MERFIIENQTFGGFTVAVNGADNARATLANALEACDDFRDTFNDFSNGSKDFSVFCAEAAARLISACFVDDVVEVTAFGEVRLVNGDLWKSLEDSAFYSVDDMRGLYVMDYLPQVDDGDEALSFPAWLEEITRNGDFEKL